MSKEKLPVPGPKKDTLPAPKDALSSAVSLQEGSPTSSLFAQYQHLLNDPLLSEHDRQVVRDALLQCQDRKDPDQCLEDAVANYVEQLFEHMLPRDRRIFGYDEDLTENESTMPRRLMFAFQQGAPFAAGALLRFLRKREKEMENLEAQTLQLLALPEAVTPSEELRKDFAERVRHFVSESCFSGSGTYGVVYEPCGEERPSQHLFAFDVAIKVYHGKEKQEKLLNELDPRRRNMLQLCNRPPQEEAELHTKLWNFLQEHEPPARVAIPRPLVYFRDYHAGQDYLIMERIPGMTLAELYGYTVGEMPHRLSERLPQWVNSTVLQGAKRELANMLAFLHEHGIFHRDLHARNIMIPTKEPRAHEPLLYMIDFGTLAMNTTEYAAYSGMGANGEPITFARDEDILSSFDFLVARYREQESLSKPELVQDIKRFIAEQGPFEKNVRIPIPNTYLAILRAKHSTLKPGDLPLFDVEVNGVRYHILRPAPKNGI